MKITDIITEAASPAQQAAIAIAKKKKQGIAEVSPVTIGSKLPKSDTATFGIEPGRGYKVNDPKDWKKGDRPRAIQQLIPTQDKKDHIRSRLGKHAAPVLPESGLAEGSLNEFAPGDGGDSGEEDTLRKFARMWYNGDDATQRRVEQALARQGWEIGELESEEGGAFVVQSGDEHGDSYIGFTADDLTEGVAEGKADYNFDIEDLKRLEQIRDLSTLKAQALALISKPSAKPMKPEKVEWFKNALERMNSPLKVIKLMYDLLLSGEGKAVVGTKSSMNPNSYRQRFGEQSMAEDKELAEEFDLIESIVEMIAEHNGVDAEAVWEDLESLTEDELYVFAVTSDPLMEDWQKANKRDKTDGMSQKAVNAYRRENPGSKLKTAVTTKPGKLKKGGKASKRRKSYCSRSRGQMKMHSISCAKTPDKAICKARRRWNC
jgi:hypothetical protein